MNKDEQAEFDALKKSNEELSIENDTLKEKIVKLEKMKGIVKASPLKPNPGFKPTYKHDAKVKVKALDGASHHKVGEEFVCSADQATHFIKLGYAEFVEVYKKD